MISSFVFSGFSLIYLVEEINGQRGDTKHKRFALKKMICHSAIEIERARREIDIHCRFGSNDNIVQLETHSIDDPSSSVDDIPITYDNNHQSVQSVVRVLMIFPFYKVQ